MLTWMPAYDGDVAVSQMISVSAAAVPSAYHDPLRAVLFAKSTTYRSTSVRRSACLSSGVCIRRRLAARDRGGSRGLVSHGPEATRLRIQVRPGSMGRRWTRGGGAVVHGAARIVL